MAENYEQRNALGRDLLGAALRVRRETVGLTRRQLAALSDVSFDSLYAIETGRRLPNLSTLLKLADAFGVTSRDLLEEVFPWDGGEPPRPAP